MAKEESPLLRDIPFHSTSVMSNNIDDCERPKELDDIKIEMDFDALFNSDDTFMFDYSEEKEAAMIDQILSNSSFDDLQNIPFPSSNVTVHNEHTVPNHLSSVDSKYLINASLSFINPPETTYHVRYLSEITNSPLEGNIVNPRIKTKKNTSGRYLKGERDRYITIALPSILSDKSNLFIRVTRLTVPYQNQSFIHPYPLLYAYPKKKTSYSSVLIQESSIYFKINKEELYSHSKLFPNIILTRLKQCHLKQMSTLRSFDDNEALYRFEGNNAKNKIAIYQLKKSQLDFRLVIQCEQSGEFFDTNIFCRSNALLEEEGVDYRKS